MTLPTPPSRREPRPEPEDVLAMGEERSPRWRRLGIAVAVAVAAVGGYQLVSGPSSPPADPATAAAVGAAGATRPVVLESWVPAVTRAREDRRSSAPTVRLGGQVVTLHGPGLAQAHRETSVAVLGRLDSGWLVAVTSQACRDKADKQQSYGTAQASGRFTPWEAGTIHHSEVWRSPDRALVLLEGGPRLVLRRAATERVVEVFRP